eukprot:6207925-Pleurochrysis_carterae.AAC.2
MLAAPSYYHFYWPQDPKQSQRAQEPPLFASLLVHMLHTVDVRSARQGEGRAWEWCSGRGHPPSCTTRA